VPAGGEAAQHLIQPGAHRHRLKRDPRRHERPGVEIAEGERPSGDPRFRLFDQPGLLARVDQQP
jgi:hypothetical protein